ncbi:MAG: glycosyltransferase family 2 protein [Candidatus Schekmanbacteria bacterium]|nr:glycosyltransferase family 2 protein [Candidatus Schekmanbacteria bacterium]
MKISLYIPCFNASLYIKRCLEGVFNQSINIDEVLIIDDGSTDNTVQIASKFDVKIISHESNKGLAAARNTAIKNSAGDYIASLDSDCVPEKNWIEKLIHEFRDNKIAGIGGMLVEGYQDKPADLWRAVNMPQHWGNELTYNPEFLFGSNNIFRKESLLKVGMYDEALGNNGEDHHISQKLKSMNYALIYTPAARAVHLRQDTVSSILRTHWNWYRMFHEPVNIENLKFRTRYNLRTSRDRIKEDIRNRQYKLLSIDLILPADQFIRDIRYFVRKR